jgi:hypothetical protein
LLAAVGCVVQRRLVRWGEVLSGRLVEREIDARREFTAKVCVPVISSRAFSCQGSTGIKAAFLDFIV